MLEIIVCLEQGVSSEELDKDTAYAPDITRKAPPEIQDDLGCSVMSC